MRLFSRLFSWLLIAVIVGTNAFPFVALAASTPPAPTCMLSVNPPVIIPGGSTTLKWSSTNASGGNITGVGPVGPQGSINLLPSTQQSTTFIGTFSGLGGTITCQATVYVSYGSQGSGDTSGGNTNTTGGATPGGTTYTQGGATQGGTTFIKGGATIPIQTPAPAPTSQPLNLTTNNTIPGALVPCGTGGFNGNGTDQNASTGCQACNLAQLTQNLVNFTIGLSIPIAAALFAWAGALYFASGPNPSRKTQANAIFVRTFIGFVVAITGWIVINTLLHVLLDSNQYPQGSWFSVQCVSEGRAVNTKVNTLLDNSLGILNTNAPIPGPPPGTTDGGITPVQQTLLVDCSNGVTAACDQLNSPNGTIAAAAAAYRGTNTSAGPDEGNLACAWAVNNVLRSAGINPIDGDSVYNMEQALKGGRGTSEDQSTAQPGDIVMFGGMSHVGICQTAGCTQVISNSSSQASFNSIYPPTSGSRFYRVNN